MQIQSEVKKTIEESRSVQEVLDNGKGVYVYLLSDCRMSTCRYRVR